MEEPKFTNKELSEIAWAVSQEGNRELFDKTLKKISWKRLSDE